MLTTLNRPNSIIEDAWLGLGDLHNLTIDNPLLSPPTQAEIENPGLLELRLMKDPKNVIFTAKALLDIDLLPIQGAILEQLWHNPFPMYIASRGFGKMEPANQPIRTQDGWTTMGEVKVGQKIYGGDGKLTTVKSKTKLQRNLVMYKLTFQDNRTIEVCQDHHWKIWDKRHKKWSVLPTKDLVKRAHRKIYAIPMNSALLNETPKEQLLHPYLLGVILTHGKIKDNAVYLNCITNQRVIDKIKSVLPDGYDIINHPLEFVTTHKIVNINKSLPTMYKLIRSVGLDSLDSKDRYIPYNYLFGSYDQRQLLHDGLTQYKNYITTKHTRLLADILDLSRSLGIHVSYHQYNEEYYTVKFKHNVDKIYITSIERAKNSSGYCIQVDNDDSTYLTKDYLVTHNSFLLAVYSTLKCILEPATKIVVVGAAFRQSRIIFEYMDTIWQNAPVLRSICDSSSGPKQSIDRCSMKLNNSTATFIPLGNGDKIRGLRATTIIGDEFASIPPEIFETVVRGFGAVSAKPIDNVKLYSKRQAMKDQGIWADSDEKTFSKRSTNQCIIAGTADYDFMPYAAYWKKYITMIRSQNDIDKTIRLPNGEVKTLREYFPTGLDESFNSKNYSIIRIPYELVPKGFMDDKMVQEAKSASHKAIYLKEFGACFPSDSDGFFKRSLIQSCVATDVNPIQLPSGPVWFDAAIQGSPGYQYVYGVDPAAENDNFSIVILELHKDHTRIVYGWSTNVKDFERRKRAGITEDGDYYGFCARKIRNLMKVFPTENIAIDAQGGGRSILEALHDKTKMQPGEEFIWPTNAILDPNKELPSDNEQGRHICHMCQFANFDFTSTANHGTRKDFEDKVLLFPRFDPVTLELAAHRDAALGDKLGVDKLYDTLEDCVMEIEELKNELSTIVMTRTGSSVGARDRWDTPETTKSDGRKTRLRKDRYSALIMANYIARSLQRTPASVGYSVIGGFAHQLAAKEHSSKHQKLHSDSMYAQGPSWFISGINAVQNGFGAINRNRGV